MCKERYVILAMLLWGYLFAVPLTIFHTNDTHGVYTPRVLKSNAKTAELGGYATLEYYLNQERQKAPRSLYLDAGDQQTGSIFAALKSDGAIGGAVIKVFNLLALDASTFGNHEFDQSPENTQRLIELAHYPFISSNLVLEKGQPLGGVPYRIFSLDSLKVGVMGLTLTELPEKVKRENVDQLTILPYKQAIDKYIDEVDRQSDLVVILTHLGYEADSLLATILDDRTDLIIGGHSHVQIDEPWQVNGIYITSAGSHTEILGKLELEVANDRIASYKTTLIPLWKPAALPKTTLNKYVQGIADSLETEMGKTIARIPVDWKPDKFAETAVSRWMAAALLAEYREAYKPDLALLNCGGFRKNLSAGEITLKDMHEMLPFGNYVVLFSCLGRDLLAMEEINQKHAVEKPYDIIQSSAEGWKTSKGWFGLGKAKQHYYLNGKKLNPNKLYRVVSHDYVAGQWDKYLGFEPMNLQETGDLILDATLRQVIKQYGINN
jgi:2',3'-cyclic-nucleotide 2'-phosphodiesterase (5'-nucleotidase family)